MVSALVEHPTPLSNAADGLLAGVVGELATDLAEALDPVSLSKRAGIVPDPWQAAVLRSKAHEQILLCCRQSGKSTITAVLAVHTALYEPGSLILLLSPGERQSKELLRKAITIFQAIGRPMDVASENTETLELANGSRIVALPGKQDTIRGYSGVRLLIIDEAAWVADATYFAVTPMLAVSGGRLLLLSTPFGRRGFLFSEWTDGGPDWHRTKIVAADVPRISPEFLAKEMGRQGPWRFEQEYNCVFTQNDDQFFASDLITAAISADVAPRFLNLGAME